MKLTFFLITVALVQVSAKGLSQRVSFNGKNVPLQEVLSAVKKQTGFFVVYKTGLLDKANPVSLNLVNVPLTDFLQEVFKNQPLNYSIKNMTIGVFRKNDPALTVDLKSVDRVLAPPGSVTGRVTNEEGEALVAANVTIKGTNFGTTTDNNGYYKIDNISPGDYTIVVSYVGYATKTATIKVTEDGVTNLNFKIVPSLVNLDQLTVTSTLSARKIRSYPGTLAEIKGKDLQNRNLNNMANVLDAIPGIIVTPGYEQFNSGNVRKPGGILIRGTSAGAQIKYLVDGIEILADILETIDPNSIEKIEVLKGPMASTLYGSGGAGGIISITTKKGKSGKSKVNFKTMFTDRSNDYADYKGYQQDYSLNVSGGQEQFNYLLGVAYNLYPTTKLTDINNGIDQKTWAYNVRIGGKINNIAADLSLQYGNEKSGSGSTDISYNKYRESLGLSTYPIYPLTDIRTFGRNFLTSLHLTHTIANNWYQDLTIGYNVTDNISANYTQSDAGTYDNNQEFLYSKINARYFMFHDHSWTPTLKTNITAGFEYNTYETRQMNISTTTPITNFFAASTPATADAGTFVKAPYSSTGYFAEAVTEFHNNLFLTTGIRYDVNPAYGDNIKSYAQPRVGLSYVIESTNLKVKPRMVWGVSSTAPDPTYKVTSLTPGLFYTNMIIGNPDIKPQRSEGYELGADLFYGSNYSLNVTYYDQKIKDMIQSAYGYDFTVSPWIFSTYYYNIGKAINRGLEVSAKAVIEPFTVDVSYTQTVSKWGDEIGQPPSGVVYAGAPNLGIPKRSTFARVSYKIPSFLPWTKKGGNISLDWRYNGSAYNFDAISYSLAIDSWFNLPDPKPTPPDLYNYLLWQKGYSFFNLRADYSIANYAALYIDVQNLLNKQGSINGQSTFQFPGRRINFGFNINF